MNTTTIQAERDKVYAQMDALEAEYKKNLEPLQKEAEKLTIKHHELPPPVLTSVSLEVGVSRISKRPATHSQGFLLLYLILPVRTNH